MNYVLIDEIFGYDIKLRRLVETLFTSIKSVLPQVIDHAFDDKAGQAFDDDHQRADEEYDGICLCKGMDGYQGTLK